MGSSLYFNLTLNSFNAINQRVTAGGQYESSKEGRISVYFRRADFYPQTYNPKKEGSYEN